MGAAIGVAMDMKEGIARTWAHEKKAKVASGYSNEKLTKRKENEIKSEVFSTNFKVSAVKLKELNVKRIHMKNVAIEKNTTAFLEKLVTEATEARKERNIRLNAAVSYTDERAKKSQKQESTRRRRLAFRKPVPHSTARTRRRRRSTFEANYTNTTAISVVPDNTRRRRRRATAADQAILQRYRPDKSFKLKRLKGGSASNATNASKTANASRLQDNTASEKDAANDHSLFSISKDVTAARYSELMESGVNLAKKIHDAQNPENVNAPTRRRRLKEWRRRRTAANSVTDHSAKLKILYSKAEMAGKSYHEKRAKINLLFRNEQKEKNVVKLSKAHVVKEDEITVKAYAEKHQKQVVETKKRNAEVFEASVRAANGTIHIAQLQLKKANKALQATMKLARFESALDQPHNTTFSDEERAAIRGTRKAREIFEPIINAAKQKVAEGEGRVLIAKEMGAKNVEKAVKAGQLMAQHTTGALKAARKAEAETKWCQSLSSAAIAKLNPQKRNKCLSLITPEARAKAKKRVEIAEKAALLRAKESSAKEVEREKARVAAEKKKKADAAALAIEIETKRKEKIDKIKASEKAEKAKAEAVVKEKDHKTETIQKGTEKRLEKVSKEGGEKRKEEEQKKILELGAKKAASDEALVKDSTNEEKQTKAKEASTKEAETKVETKTKADERNFKQRRAKLEKEIASLSAGKPGNLVGAEADKELLQEQWQKKKKKLQGAMQQEAKQQHV